MTQFSANLGFLWADKSLPDAIHAAKQAGFDAVECHWPYTVKAQDVIDALKDTSMDLMGLNTTRGNVANGDNGLSAVPGRDAEARLYIDEAVDYAASVGARNIHVMAGFSQGIEAQKQFVDNLRYAVKKVADLPLSLVIEPLNKYDAPDYFLSTTLQAESIIKEVGSDKLRLMFDCYHVQIMQGNLSRLFAHHLDIIGHVQFASVPDRGPPDTGEVNYAYLFEYMHGLGYNAPLGAEYKPVGNTDASLTWINKLQ